MVLKTQGFGRVKRATAVSRRQVPTIQTILKSLKVLTQFKPVFAGDHEVSVDASAE